MGTLVVRIMGSSVLVEDVVDGGVGGAVGCGAAALCWAEVVLGVACDVVRVKQVGLLQVVVLMLWVFCRAHCEQEGKACWNVVANLPPFS